MGNDKQALTRLAAEHRVLVQSIARRLKRRLGRLVELEDLEAHGMEGLLTAARRYQPGRGATFATFAGHRIRGAMLDAIPTLRGLPRRERAGEDPRAPRPEGAWTQPSTDEGAEQAALAREDHERVRRALTRLPRRERLFIDRIYFEDQVIARAGVELGLSRSWASRVHARAITRLRRELEERAA